MKRIMLMAQLLLSVLALHAQKLQNVLIAELPVLAISDKVSLHIISPQKISYVDLSSSSLFGDLPEKNVLRIKAVPDSASSLILNADAGIVTIVGETFIAQYKLSFVSSDRTDLISSQVEITPEHMKAMDVSGISIPQNEIKINAISLLKRRDNHPLNKVSAYGLSITVNQVYTLGDYVLLDFGFRNDTNLRFDVDELRFKIEDKKINKSTNVQSVEIQPIFQLYPFERFKRSFRNIYAFRKITFPGDKVFTIELSERQISGRKLFSKLQYSDILSADTF